MNLFMISCKKATYLLSKKEENKLSWLEKLKLRSHLTICSICRKFEQQTGFIILNTKHVHVDATLSIETKEKMETAVKRER
jgi:hypothetical protein